MTPQEAQNIVKQKYPEARCQWYANGCQIEYSRIVMRATPGLGCGQTEDEAWLNSVPLLGAIDRSN